MAQSRTPDAPTLTIPDPIRELIVALTSLGGPAWLVGEGLADLLGNRTPSAFQICAATPVESWLARFPQAVPTQPAKGQVMIPTAAGPADVSAPCKGKDVLEDLARRCFTIHAVAWNPVSDEWLDPFDGRADGEARRLRTVGNPGLRIAEDPVRALRAVRIATERRLELDPALREALPGALQPLTPAVRLRARREILPLLLSPAAGDGVALLRGTGIEGELVPDALPDSGAVITRLPLDLALRLAAWLRGGNAPQVLARLRVGRDLALRVQRLLRHHPVDAVSKAPARALRRLADEDITALFALRRAEVAASEACAEKLETGASPPSREDLDRLEQSVWASRSEAAAVGAAGRVALGGKQVMELLGCGPGPHVGQALRFLGKCVADEPTCNTEAQLRTRLVAWSQSTRD